MACTSGYQLWSCASPAYTGCCLVDACKALGCPPGSTAPLLTLPGATLLQPTQTTQSSPRRNLTVTVIPPLLNTIVEHITTTTSRFPQTPTASTTQSGATASSNQLDAIASSTQQSPTTSSTQSGAKSPSHSPSPLLSIIAGSIGGVLGILIIALIIFLYRRRRRRRKSENSAEGLPTHGGVPEPTLDDGPATGISNPTQNPVLTPTNKKPS